MGGDGIDRNNNRINNGHGERCVGENSFQYQRCTAL